MSYAEIDSRGKLTGYWVGSYRSKRYPKPFRQRFKTKAEADGYEAYVKASGQEPVQALEAPTRSLKSVAEAFREKNSHWGKRDRPGIQRLEWILDQIGNLDIAAVTTDELDKLVARLEKLPGRKPGTRMSNTTINHYLNALAAVLTWAHQRRLIAHKPHVPLKPAKSERILIVQDDLEDTLFQWIERNCKTLNATFAMKVLIETGLRRGELWQLRPDQVTWDQNENGEENGWITLDLDQTKTDEARTVWIEADMARKLRALIVSKALPKAYRVYRIFKKAVKACCANPDLTLHSMRHTRATRMIDSGVDSLIVAKSLGHRSLATTKKYVHPQKAALAQAGRKVCTAAVQMPKKGSVVDFPISKTGS